MLLNDPNVAIDHIDFGRNANVGKSKVADPQCRIDNAV
jgi:hypothetical protein